MLQVSVVALVAIFVIGFVNSYEFQGLPQEDPNDPGKCVNPTNGGEALTPGVHYNNRCEKITCSPEFAVLVVGCGVSIPPPGCKEKEGDFTKQYPECCKTFECD